MFITVSSLNLISRCKRQWSAILRRVIQSSKVVRWKGPSRESRRGMSGYKPLPYKAVICLYVYCFYNPRTPQAAGARGLAREV